MYCCRSREKETAARLRLAMASTLFEKLPKAGSYSGAMDDPNVTYEADETFDSVSVSSVSSVDTYSDLGSPRQTGVRGVLQAGDKLRERVEDFCNDIHDAYTFDLNPEYRVKIVKKFDGLSVGARFDFKSGDCVLKAKRAPSARPEGGSRLWRWFKKVEVQPEDRELEVFREAALVGRPDGARDRRVQSEQGLQLAVQNHEQAVGKHAGDAAAAVRGGRERARHRGGPLGPRRETTQGGGRHRRRHDPPPTCALRRGELPRRRAEAGAENRPLRPRGGEAQSRGGGGTRGCGAAVTFREV